jgi:hypothetical protein
MTKGRLERGGSIGNKEVAQISGNFNYELRTTNYPPLHHRPDGPMLQPKAIHHRPDGPMLQPKAIHHRPDGPMLRPKAIHHRPDGPMLRPKAVHHRPDGPMLRPKAARYERKLVTALWCSTAPLIWIRTQSMSGDPRLHNSRARPLPKNKQRLSADQPALKTVL